MVRYPLVALVALVALAGAPVLAADPPKVDRAIGKQPAYKTAAPQYALLAFGPGAKHRVWLVQDGDTLHVDRNGNGDLTDPGEAVPAKRPREGVTPDEGEYTFEAGELAVGGQTHKGLVVSVSPLARFRDTSIGDHPDAKAALAKDPKATAVSVRVAAAVPGLAGGGTGGRVSFTAGFLDAHGVLRFAAAPAAAPVVWLGGPLEVTFYAGPPALRVGREGEFVLVVGTPGAGPGTFAMVQFADTIPDDAFPVADLTFPAARPGDPPVRARYELKQRC